MIRDGLGNEIKPGDIVFVQVGTIWLQALVTGVKEGGTIIPVNKQQQGVTPDTLSLQFDLACIDVPPGQNHQSIRRLINPDKEAIRPKGN